MSLGLCAIAVSGFYVERRTSGSIQTCHTSGCSWLSDRQCSSMRLDGMVVYADGDFPRLPVLGLRAIADNNLVLTVNGRKREATLRTPLKWWWPFA